MKTSTLRALPSTLLMLGFAALCLSYADLYAYQTGMIGGSPANAFLGLLVLLTSGTLMGCVASAEVRGRVFALYTSHTAVLIGLAGIVCFSFISGFVATAKWDEGPVFVLFPAYDVTIILLSMLLPFPAHQRRRFRVYFAIAFVIATASVLTDAIHPGTFSIIADRAAGFARNPNIAAFLLVTLCCAVVTYDRVRVRDLLAILVTAIGVLTTFSRSGAILLVFLVLCYTGLIASHARHPGRALARFGAVAFTAAVVGQSAAVLIHRAEIFSLSTTRLGMLTGQSQLLPERDPRRAALDASLQLVREAPLVGLGSGFTGNMREGPHNIYLQQWINNGLPGLAAYLWLIAAAARVFWQRRYHTGLVFVGLVAIFGLFSHNVLDDRAFLVPLGAMLTLSVPRRVRPCAG